LDSMSYSSKVSLIFCPIYIFEVSVYIFICGLFQLTSGIHMLIGTSLIRIQDFSSVRLHTQGMTYSGFLSGWILLFLLH
jgi:hypothetical protein